MTPATTKLSSYEVKQAERAERGEFPRWLFVHELREMLEEFGDNDWAEVNQVGNINVYREDNKSWSTIDLYWARLEHWKDA